MIYKINSSSNLKEIGRIPQTVPMQAFHKKAKRTDYIGSASDNEKKTISHRFYNFLKPYLPEHQVLNKQFSNDIYKMDWKKMDYVIKKDLKQEFYNYKVINISKSLNSIINISESIFFVDYVENYNNQITLNGIPKDYFQNTKHDFIKLNSHENYKELFYSLRLEKKKKIIIPKKLKFELKDDTAQIFRLHTPINNLSGYYVLESLKNKILEQGFTGMNFIPLNEINPNIDIEIL